MTVTAATPVRRPERPDVAPRAHRVLGGVFSRLAGLLVFIGVLGLVVLLSIAVGANDIPPATVWDVLFSSAGGDESVIVHEMRIPRTLVGLAVGIALGVAGALIQALTRNPLADPGILGVNAGAAFSVAVGISVFGVTAISDYVWFAFAGALVVTLMVYVIGSAGRGAASPVRLTLAGVALGAVLTGMTSALMLTDPDTFEQMRHWNAGSFAARDLELLAPVVPFLLAGIVLAGGATRALNAIALGDDLAASLGTSVTRTRVMVVLAVTLLAGGATAIAGPIAFVGLMVPHVARWIVGPDQRWILAYTMVLAPVVILVSDVIGRVVVRPGEVPVGIVTAFVGAPVLIALVRRRHASGL